MIHHFSASQITKFSNEPALWMIEYLMGVKGGVGPAAWRGRAVEAGLKVRMLKTGWDFEDCCAQAMTVFEEEAQGDLADDVQTQRDAIPDYLTQALLAAADWTSLLTTQARIETHVPGVDIPLIGYTDFQFPELTRDLKTTKQCPSSLDRKREHVWQMAIYHKATGDSQSLVYVTPKKWAEFPVGDDLIEPAWKAVCATVRAMAAILNDIESRGVESVAAFYPPRDINHFLWDDATREKAREVWNL